PQKSGTKMPPESGRKRGKNGSSCITVFSGGGQRTEHHRRGGIPASVPAHPFHAAEGSGGGAWETASDPRRQGLPEGGSDRGRNDSAEARGGNSGSGPENGK